jgi:hypothetical protein
MTARSANGEGKMALAAATISPSLSRQVALSW